MTTYTENEIKQLIVNELGFPSGMDFTSTTDETVIKINLSYNLIKEDTLSKYRWGFATTTVDLGTETDITDNKYLYTHTLPTDFLALITVYSDVNRNGVIQDYEVYDGLIYSNNKDVFLEYTLNQTEDKFPAYFVEYLKVKGAFDNCFDLTGDTNLLQILDKRNSAEWIKATNLDVRGKRTKVIRSAPYIAIRGR